MAIANKTRKILWGRSGNRCALCRRELVIDITAGDDESVVGDECHIVSAKDRGPRFDPALATERLDELDNLILLCRIHHKMVDDQSETYTVKMLTMFKANHEKWVSSTLDGILQIPPIRIRRIEANTPSSLVRLTSGRDVMAVVGGAFQFSFDHEEPRSEAEAELIGEFFQDLQDYGDMWEEIDSGERVKATFGLSERLRKLEEVGLWCFGAREIRQIEGGVGQPSPWPIALLKVVPSECAEVCKPTQNLR